MTTTMRTLLVATVLCCPAWAGEDSKPADLPCAAWKEGSAWKVSVEVYSRPWLFDSPDKKSSKGELPEVITTYTLNVVVSAQVKEKDVDCWQVDFLPDKDAGDAVKDEKYRVLVDIKTGLPTKVSPLSRGLSGTTRLVSVGAMSAIIGTPNFVPLAFLPVRPSVLPDKARDETMSITVAQIFDMSIWDEGKKREELRVRQKWQAGDKWWTEYEAYEQGHLVLRAKRIDGQPAVKNDDKDNKAK